MSQIYKPNAGGAGLVPIETINGDTGFISGSTVTIYANNASNVSGATVKFVNSGTTSTLELSDGSAGDTLLGSGAGGTGAITGGDNTAVGETALSNIGGSTSNNNVAVGQAAGFSLGTGAATSGYNTLVGAGAMGNAISSLYNTVVGESAASSYTSNESSNIIIGRGVTGTVGESHVVRIGNQGSGNAQQNKCFIAGITGATPTSANTPQVVLCDNIGNLASISSSTSGFILTSNGTATPSFQAPATSGTVTSVSGTPNQVAVANGTTTPVISLIGPYTPATYTAHGVLIGEGTSSIVALGAGTAGQVLQSGGAIADPSYSTATYPSTAGTNGNVLTSNGTNWVSSAHITLLQTINASSSASINFTGLTGYDQYEVQFYNVITSGVTTFQNIQFSTDNGATWQATNYNYSSAVAYPNTGGQEGSTSQSSIVICTVATDSATLPWSGWQRFQNFNTAHAKSTYGQNISQFNGCLQFQDSGYWTGATVVNGIRFIPDTGTYTSGTFKLYGIP